VRERDYFFVVSFVVWGLWAGIGLGELAAGLRARLGSAARAAPAVLLLVLVPVGLNWKAASRRGGADARLAADFAYDLLNSAPPHAVLFTYGDNDTFPLWWAQEVERIRQDVTVVCLALANTDWYMRQLRDTPPRPVDASTLPAVWRERIGPAPRGPLHTMSDSTIAAAMHGYSAPSALEVQVGPLSRTIPKGSFLYPNDLLTLAVLRQNIGKRPIVWASTTGRSFAGLGDYVVQRGLGFELLSQRPDTTDPALDLHRFNGVPLDVVTTGRLVFDTYRYAGLRQHGVEGLESTSASVAAELSLPPTFLVFAYAARSDHAGLTAAADLAIRLTTSPDLRSAIRAVVDSVAQAAGTTPQLPAGPLQ